MCCNAESNHQHDIVEDMQRHSSWHSSRHRCNICSDQQICECWQCQAVKLRSLLHTWSLYGREGWLDAIARSPGRKPASVRKRFAISQHSWIQGGCGASGSPPPPPPPSRAWAGCNTQGPRQSRITDRISLISLVTQLNPGRNPYSAQLTECCRGCFASGTHSHASSAEELSQPGHPVHMRNTP